MLNISILGTGNMGQALAGPWMRSGRARVKGYDKDQARLAQAAEVSGITPVSGLQDLLNDCDFLLLAVKPQQIKKVLIELSQHIAQEMTGLCLISIAAGIPLKKLQKWSGKKCPIVRIMPNTPALVEKGAFALCLDDPQVSKQQAEQVEGLFSLLGRVYPLAEEMFDAYTALIGSGPAYVFYLMEALIEAGVFLGLTRDQAQDMVKVLLAGSSRLAELSPLSVGQLREMVTSPAGTTIAALQHLDRQAVRAAVVDAVVRARDRSRELG